MACKQLFPIVIDILEPDIATVIASYDQIQIHRSVSGEGGPYKELTDINTPTVTVNIIITEITAEIAKSNLDFSFFLFIYN